MFSTDVIHSHSKERIQINRSVKLGIKIKTLLMEEPFNFYKLKTLLNTYISTSPYGAKKPSGCKVLKVHVVY